MNIAIVGAGISGISTALELARDGHHVTVYEQLNAAAEASSFAPGGWLLPCITHTLSTPGLGMPVGRLRKGKDLLHAPGMVGSATWRWLRQWKQREKHWSQHGAAAWVDSLLSLSDYSASLRWLGCEEPDIAAEPQAGALVLLRSDSEHQFWQAQLTQIGENAIDAQLLTREQALQIEPALGTEVAWTHAVHFAQAESINPRLWTHYLRTQAQALGVQLRTGCHIQRISTTPVGVVMQERVHPHDAVVLCTGPQLQLLQALDLRLPIACGWGYSVTAPVRDPLQAPRNAVMDWAQQATICRMGQRVRITAGMELNTPPDAEHRSATLQRMYQLLNDWFPGGAHLSSPQVQVWRGARSYLPDGLPAVGRSNHPNVWLNFAHGSHGVSLAAGCARLLADQMAGRTPAMDTAALNPLRFLK